MGSTVTRVPTGSGQSSPASTIVPDTSWPISIGTPTNGPKMRVPEPSGKTLWRSLPQMPANSTATRAHAGPGNVGSSMSASETGNSGSTMSKRATRTAAA